MPRKSARRTVPCCVPAEYMRINDGLAGVLSRKAIYKEIGCPDNLARRYPEPLNSGKAKTRCLSCHGIYEISSFKLGWNERGKMNLPAFILKTLENKEYFHIYQIVIQPLKIR